MNELVRAREVRVIDSEGEKVGILPTERALAMAQESGLDLVEVAPNAEPPVCRIMDYNKLRYEKQRKMKEARKNQRQTETKEVKFRPSIEEHDYQVKLTHLRDFLLKGNKCKVSLQFKRHQMRRYDQGRDVVERVLKDIEDIAVVESRPSGQGRQILAIVAPNREVLHQAEKEFKQELQQKKEAHEKRLAEKNS